MQYYLNYVLGWTFPANQKAEMGTVVHKVLEILAKINWASKIHKKNFTLEDDCIGEIKVDLDLWLKPSFLTNHEVDEINTSRLAKSIYKHDCFIDYGTHRKGRELVDDIFERVYNYYVGISTHKWTKANKKHCYNWTWMPLEYKNGLFDPRLSDVLDVEQRFDIEIDRPWAEYNYILPDDQEIKGNLALKGTIDLITGNEDTVEIVDYKTGQRLDWITGQQKTYAKLKTDPQLMFYYYAAKHLYPNAKQIILSIYFIRDGGPFTLCFEKKHFDEMEVLLEKKFKNIMHTHLPKMLDPEQKNWKCDKLCPFAKNKFNKSDESNMCLTAHRHIELYGLDATTEKYFHPDHEVGHYAAPG